MEKSNQIEENKYSENEAKYESKILKARNGFIGVLVHVGIVLLFAILLAVGIIILEFSEGAGIALSVVAGTALTIYFSVVWFCHGFVIVSPNENAVMVLFGKYHGTINKDGFYFINPFAKCFNPTRVKLQSVMGMPAQYDGSKKISVKQQTLDNQKQKVNDLRGNPIEIGVVVVWKVVDAANAAFNVENYINYISVQADASIRTIARQYPYDDDNATGSIEKSLRGSAVEVAEKLRESLQEKVLVAGIEIIEARISHLAYAPEIASSMLQRQQAQAVVDARKTIVEGAVGMVELALDRLRESGCVDLDEERKAQMVSNLMVVLCSNKDTQPIVNTGTIY